MVLSTRRENEMVPQYSLTGDLLSFLRCGLQYRYHNGSSLPPSRPVQLWFGEFIHGVMEAAYRIWRDTNPSPAFPWPINKTPYRGQIPANRVFYDIGTIGDTVEATLRAKGKNPRDTSARNSAYERASLAVNELGPHLFPLISTAEEMVIGTREIPPLTLPQQQIRASLYELHGIIDVVTDVQFNGVPSTNVIKRAIAEAIPNLQGQFEVLVDYKGTRRDSVTHPYWNQHEWQIQTYAWLRQQIPQSHPVIAGVVLYINELAPNEDDLVTLKKEIQNQGTDVIPPNGSQDYYLLNTWQTGNAIPNLSVSFRIARALRIIPIHAASQLSATQAFDRVVADIETCANKENTSGTIMTNWGRSGDQNTCAACDFRHFCPSPYPHNTAYTVNAPHAP